MAMHAKLRETHHQKPDKNWPIRRNVTKERHAAARNDRPLPAGWGGGGAAAAPGAEEDHHCRRVRSRLRATLTADGGGGQTEQRAPSGGTHGRF